MNNQSIAFANQNRQTKKITKLSNFQNKIPITRNFAQDLIQVKVECAHKDNRGITGGNDL
jgi:hypothetical protein